MTIYGDTVPLTTARLYMASKAKHGPRWQQMRGLGYRIVSTWIDESGTGQTADWADLWRRNIREASTADALIAYREPGETMKGALSEIGAALASGVPVFWLGDEDGYTVRNHSGVVIVGSLRDALLGVRRCRPCGYLCEHGYTDGCVNCLQEPRGA